MNVNQKTMMDREKLSKLGLSSNVSSFFSKLIELEVNIRVATLYQKDNKYSTNVILKELHKNLEPIISNIIEGYQGLYIITKIDNINIGTIDPVDYLSKFYEMLKEAKGFFIDHWIHKEIDELSRLISVSLFKLKYEK